MNDFMLAMRDMHKNSPELKISKDSRLVVISDMHMGDGGKSDDFVAGAPGLHRALQDYYLKQDYHLILNGDIEELQKFKLNSIRQAWPEIYDLFHQFKNGPGLTKILGNHDISLKLHQDYEFKTEEALRLSHGSSMFLAFHGHQSYRLFSNYNHLVDFFIRYLARPLRIPNLDKPVTSRRRYKAEQRIYQAARQLGLIAIVGHTHRPLFESHSKYDRLRISLERLLRDYSRANARQRASILPEIRLYSAEFQRLGHTERRRKHSRSIYNRSDLLVPCVFNSGCVTSRQGFTSLEIVDSCIALVFWGRPGSVRPYIEREALDRQHLGDSGWCRYVLAKEALDYIFARNQFLSS